MAPEPLNKIELGVELGKEYHFVVCCEDGFLHGIFLRGEIWALFKSPDTTTRMATRIATSMVYCAYDLVNQPGGTQDFIIDKFIRAFFARGQQRRR